MADEPNAHPGIILTIGPDQKPMEFARRITRPSQNLLVLLDPSHAEAFKNLRNFMLQPRLRTAPAGNALL